MKLVHLDKGELLLGTKFLKKHFQAGSRPSKRELARKILAGTVPGWVEGGTEDGTPWVDEQAWLDCWGSAPPPAEEGPKAGLFLFSRSRVGGRAQ